MSGIALGQFLFECNAGTTRNGCSPNRTKGIFSHTPEPHVAFCSIFVHQLFPMFEPTIKNGSFLSVVALVSVTLLDSNPSPSQKKNRFSAEMPAEGPKVV